MNYTKFALALLVVVCFVGLTAANSLSTTVAPPADPNCDSCKQAVDMLKSVVPQYKEQAKQWCNICPSREKCRETIDKYADLLMKTSSEQICKMAGMCVAGGSPLFPFPMIAYNTDSN